MNLANLITAVRIVLSPIFFVSFLFLDLKIALTLFLLTALTDLLDGYFARKEGPTNLGAVLDPIADKTLVMFALLGLIIKFNFSLVYAAMVFSREIFLIAAAIIIFTLVLVKKRKIGFEKLDLKAGKIGKAVTLFQNIALIALIMQFQYQLFLVYFVFILSLVCICICSFELKKIIRRI